MGQLYNALHGTVRCGSTYTVMFETKAASLAVTVPAALVSVRVKIAIEPLVAYSVLVLVVVKVLFVSVLMMMSTVPMIVGVMYWLHE